MLNYACDGPEKDNITGYIVFSSLVKPGKKTKLNKLSEIFLMSFSKVLPSVKRSINIAPKYMSHNPEMVKKIEDDKLMIREGSLKSCMKVNFVIIVFFCYSSFIIINYLWYLIITNLIISF